jgi:hypothetical protein
MGIARPFGRLMMNPHFRGLGANLELVSTIYGKSLINWAMVFGIELATLIFG